MDKNGVLLRTYYMNLILRMSRIILYLFSLDRVTWIMNIVFLRGVPEQTHTNMCKLDCLIGNVINYYYKQQTNFQINLIRQLIVSIINQ